MASKRLLPPPPPYSERMAAAFEVYNAFRAQHQRLFRNAMRPENKGEYHTHMRYLQAAQMQTDAALMQMWIIHDEEKEKQK